MLLFDKQSNKAQHLQHGKVAVDALGKALSTTADSVTGQVVSGLSPAGAYAIGQYFKNNDALNRQDGGNRAGEGSQSHLLAHGLLAAATSYATGQSVETITASSITTMGAEKLAPALGKLLYGTEQAADLTAEQKQTISNVLGTVGVVAGVVTAQATGADSYETATSAVNVQGSVQNAVENNNWSELANSSLVQSAKAGNGINYNEINNNISEQYPISEFLDHVRDKNHMTITSINIGMVSYTIVVNNKNGDAWVHGYKNEETNETKTAVGIGVSFDPKDRRKPIEEYAKDRPLRIKFGGGMSIQAGTIINQTNPNTKEINDAIRGVAGGTIVCKWLCVGVSKGRGTSGATILTTGIGTPQIGMGGGVMRPMTENEKAFFKKIGVLK